ncbi:YtxH domain-containing protein [Corallococcus exiguus]|uniref:YtxH domain-containing protein n=1 Tax=Corallococcus TaxID=83461 RepID=UPI000EA00EA4|nr:MULTISPECIES: YtxH domain-containing protein [Corallococcus]NRD56528.1 YtxH domain-containing protein [Corallococcus exiguus]NRD63667.1 YtxH domain-containing protein [Corallococcus exiguus]RKH22038.1 YtxH domain-containing protein [Corallococcus sp. CA041A]RUO88393.1 YtxH domain-containing protein [Corallococcus sp. AB018]
MFRAKKATWQAKAFAKSKLYRQFLAHQLLDQLPDYADKAGKVARKSWDNFDPDDALRYVGLTTYKPARVGMGGLGAFLLGAAAGSIVALLMAPSRGTELRTTVKDKAMGYINKQGVNIGGEKTASA